ncbi:hypothetical protein Ade02nite_31380 [Paractinoplanes deccanensis]|uniref:Uncharacterized protein n=1 Tax=Paractinoplanes deccanensis TaxID=113561 RepID=A0ABQ3Y3G6_9ACTN|nr:hypothetical protein [Actinoplanes deccanensis]GID74497.1 hypothetical protein Ade02nite_31380 [Actinoplanes deccanensis]
MPVVLLLHDQLLDARVWRGFAGLVSGHADVRTVTEPPPAVFRGRPREWAADVAAAARSALPASGPVDLVLAVGWAIEAAIVWCERGLARRALLVNPWPPAATFGPTAPPPDAAERPVPPAHEPGPSDLAVRQLDEGMVGEEAMSYMLEVAWESDRLDIVRELLSRRRAG